MLFIHGIYSIGGLLWMAFVLWMIVDCLRAQDNFYWIFLILFFQPFGAILYFLTHKLTDFELTSRLAGLWSSGRRVRELKAQIHSLDRPYHWTKLGDEYLLRREWREAARCYEEALLRDPQIEEAHYGKGRACLALGQYDQAIQELMPIVGKNPRYGFGEGLLTIARAWRGLKCAKEAMSAYEEYALLLEENGRHEEAMTLMKQIYEDGRNSTGFARAQERRWGRAAGRFLRAHRL